MSNQTPNLTPDEIAVLEIIEMGWFKYLSLQSAGQFLSRLYEFNLIDYTGETIAESSRADMSITDAGIAALDLLDPKRKSKAR